jgi:phytoene synthase
VVENQQTSLEYCLDRARSQDHDRYLCALYAPKDVRNAIMVLLAFNNELAEVNDKVSEPMLGEIRLQWWRDALEDLYKGTVRKHPVVQSMDEVAMVKRLDEDVLMGLVDARVPDIYNEQAKSSDDLVSHLGDVAGDLHVAMGYLLVGDKITDEQQKSLKAVGTAWGLLGLIKACCFQAGVASDKIPDDVLVEAGISRESLYEGHVDHNMVLVIKDLVGKIRLASNEARGLSKLEAKPLLPALLSLRLVNHYLGDWENNAYDPNYMNKEKGILGRQWTLFKAALFGNY